MCEAIYGEDKVSLPPSGKFMCPKCGSQNLTKGEGEALDAYICRDCLIHFAVWPKPVWRPRVTPYCSKEAAR